MYLIEIWQGKRGQEYGEIVILRIAFYILVFKIGKFKFLCGPIKEGSCCEGYILILRG